MKWGLIPWRLRAELGVWKHIWVMIFPNLGFPFVTLQWPCVLVESFPLLLNPLLLPVPAFPIPLYRSKPSQAVESNFTAEDVDMHILWGLTGKATAASPPAAEFLSWRKEKRELELFILERRRLQWDLGAPSSAQKSCKGIFTRALSYLFCYIQISLIFTYYCFN